jgi:hypothetical protein
MKRITMGICAGTLLVIGAVGAAPAVAAEPIFEHAIIVPIKETETIPFTTSSKGAGLETVGGKKIACKGSNAKGAITGPKTIAKFVVKFTECEGLASKCNSTGAAAGEIVTTPFGGTLGDLKSESTPGIAFTPEGVSGVAAEFTCGTTGVVITSGVVGPITTVGKLEARLSLNFKETKGVQLFESLFGAPLDVFKTSFNKEKAEQTGLGSLQTVVPSEPIEVS